MMRIAKKFRTPIAILVGVMAAAFWANAGFSSSCTGSEPLTTVSLPTSGELRIKYVFVSFAADVEITAAQHAAVTDIVSWYVENQSHGRLKISADSGIVFRPGEGFGPGEGTPYAWRAEQSPGFYQTMPNDASHNDYVNTWSPRTGTWWYGATVANPRGDNGYATHLNTEIFWKIRDAFPANSPFDAPQGQVVDAVVMIYLSANSPFGGGVDGRPNVHLKANVMKSESDYFDDLSSDYYGFIGTTQIEYTP